MNGVHVILAIMLGLDAWWWWNTDRKLRPLPRALLWRSLALVWILLQVLLLEIRFLPARVSRPIIDVIPLPIIAGQYFWHLIILPFVILPPILWRWIKEVIRAVRRTPSPSESTPAAPTAPLSRRQLLSRAAVAVPPLIVAGGAAGSIQQFGQYRLSKLNVPLRNLPPALHGLTIAHLSDFHAGRFMTPAIIRRVIDDTNALNPDLVLITGDLIDYALSDLPAAMENVLRLKPKYGIKGGLAMCIGNHDLFESGDRFCQEVRRAGIPLLAENVRTIEVNKQLIQLAGIGYYSRDDHAKAALDYTIQGLDRTDAGGFPILLAHHPHAFDEAARLGFPLTLSGHTHGGQLMATRNFGAGSVMFRYWSGLYSKPDGSKLVVNNGVGNWFPLRINAPAEISLLTLVPEPTA